MSFRKNIQVDIVASPNFVLASDPSASNKTPTYRALVAADIPSLPLTKISGWTDAATALTSLLPSQSGKVGYILSTDGTSASWVLGGNSTITLSGDATGSGTSAITVALSDTGVTDALLTNYVVGSNAALAATDSILSALGKIQGQINSRVASSLVGAANGVASLDSGGKVHTSQLPAAVLGSLTYQGVWNASTNSPTIPTASASNDGWYYKVSVAGTTVVDTISDWGVGDWIISNGTTWDKIDNTDAVSSVAGKTGAVTLSTTDVTEGTSLYYTDARVRAVALTGYTAGSNTALAATDTLLAAMGKIQGQLNAKQASGSYLTANQTITVSGDATGSGTTAIALTLKNTGTAGTYRSVTTDAQGRVTAGQAGDIVPVVTKTANYTALSTDSAIFVNAASNAVVITLPAAPVTGQRYDIKRIDSVIANAVSVSGNSKNIDEAATQSISSQYDCLTVIYNGTQWYII